MIDYNKLLDEDLLDFIAEVDVFLSLEDSATTPNAQRAAYARMAAHFATPRPNGVTHHDEMINDIPTRVYDDQGEITVVYCHGGGFLLGNLETHDDICAEIAHLTRRRVVAVDYRLSPEHKHPAAYEDALAVARHWLPRGAVILVGDSAGGQLAAAVSGTLRHYIRGQVLIYPALGGDVTKGSYVEHAEAPMLSTKAILAFNAAHGGDPNDPTLNPLRGSSADLPPSYVFAAEADPLLDDSVQYCAAIKAAGGTAVCHIDAGLVHGHLRARHRAKRARASFARVIEAVTRLASKQ